MKKTIIALVALSGLAMASDLTFYTDPNRTTNGQDIANGFILKLSDNFMAVSDPTITETEFQLQSVALSCTNDGGSYTNDVKMAIFARPGVDQVGTFVGLSDNTVTKGSSALTFNFTDVTLAKDTQYQFFFVTSNTVATVFSTTEKNVDAYNTVKANFRFDRATCGEAGNYMPQGDGITWGPFSGWSGQNNAVVTFTMVPEPATATLSLLALAGLASRRRRH